MAKYGTWEEAARAWAAALAIVTIDETSELSPESFGVLYSAAEQMAWDAQNAAHENAARDMAWQPATIAMQQAFELATTAESDDEQTEADRAVAEAHAAMAAAIG